MSRWSRTAGVSVGLVGLAVAGWIGVHLSRDRSLGPSELQALANGRDGSRPIEPRLSGGVPHGPLRNARGDLADTATPHILLAAARLQERAKTTTDLQVARAAAAALLLTGRTDRALEELEHLITRSPNDAATVSDLAATLQVRYGVSRRPDELVRSLALSGRARDLDATLLEARFNHALAAEHLLLSQAAIRAWDDYLQHDATSPWAAEARARRAALERREAGGPAESDLQRALDENRETLLALVTSAPQTSRRFVDRVLLSESAKAVLTNDALAVRSAHARALRMGRALLEATGDRYALDLAAGMPDGTGPITPTVRRTAEGLLAYQEGRALFDNDRTAEATAAFEKAKRLLGGLNRPAALSARYYLAIWHYYQGRLDDGLRDLADLEPAVRAASYIHLQSRIHYMRGLFLQTGARPSEALAALELAFKLAEQAGDPDGQVGILSQGAGTLDMLGEAREAWRRRLQAIGLFPNSDSWRRKHVLLLAAARAALAQGLPEAALVFQNEALENARAWQQPGGFEEVFAYRARTYIALGQHAAAVEDIKQARSWLARVPDRGLVARFEAELATTESLALASAAPSRAVEAATESIGKLTAAGGAFRLASAYLMRGQARLRADDPRNAEMDFSSGIEAFEAERNTIPSMRARLTAFPQGRELFKSLVAVKASLGKRDEAFAAAERGRARALLEALGHRDLVTSPSTVQAALASDEALLYYTVLEDRLLVWVIKNEGTWSTDRMIGSEPLSVLADRFRRELTSNAERTPAGETLYELLIGPLRAQVGSATSLVVVPDEALHTIPFAALRDRDRGRFLIEDYALTLTPSASVYVSKRPQQTARRSVRHALVVGVGRDESAANPLPLLPHAEQEAARVGDIYASRRVIVGGSATAQNFAAFAPDADVIHFAGHAVANEEYPALSRLVLAPDPGTGTTALYSYELSRLHFSATSMVVLAGCRTAAGANVLGEGLLSLARPFVEAGVPAVVGTLWDLDDRGAQEFFTTFHRAALKDAPHYALRTAQLSFVHAPKTELRLPSAWAGVVLISGASR